MFLLGKCRDLSHIGGKWRVYTHIGLSHIGGKWRVYSHIGLSHTLSVCPIWKDERGDCWGIEKWSVKVKVELSTLLGRLNVMNFISSSTLVVFKLIKNIIPHVTLYPLVGLHENYQLLSSSSLYTTYCSLDFVLVLGKLYVSVVSWKRLPRIIPTFCINFNIV